MESFKEFFFIILYRDNIILSNSSFLWIIYLSLFIILFIENGVLPAAFLPGDSLLILIGVLTSKNILNYKLTIIVLTSGASLGYWLGYIQGKWISKSKIIKSWLTNLPNHYHKKAYNLFYRYGLSSLLIGRFLPFIRTLLPIIAGFSGLKNKHFQIFNWLSGLFWVLSLTSIGNIFCKNIIFKQYERYIINTIILISIIVFIIGLLYSVIFFIRKYYKK